MCRREFPAHGIDTIAPAALLSVILLPYYTQKRQKYNTKYIKNNNSIIVIELIFQLICIKLYLKK